MKPVEGILYSQIGYDAGSPKRVVVRASAPDAVAPTTVCEVVPENGTAPVIAVPVERWGELWGSHWWVADIGALDDIGTYRAVVRGDGLIRMRSDLFEIGPSILWRNTWREVALEQMRRRVIFAKDRTGWCDCGSTLREANSHAVMIIGLCDLLEHASGRMTATEREQVCEQIRHGAGYLALCQDLAREKGLGEGAIAHEHTHQHLVVPGDVVKGAVALACAARLACAQLDHEMLARAEAAFRWFGRAQPYGQDGFCAWAHGAPDGYQVPRQFMTRDILTAAWAAWELSRAGVQSCTQDAIALLDTVMSRQVPIERSEDGLYGHFYGFDDCAYTEKAWEHHAVGHDCGATFPHYLIPMVEMYQAMPGHPRAGAWRACLERFTYGYLVPSCSRNPFGILPQGVFGDEGLLCFGGLWHGSSGAYAHAAALALELERLFGGAELREIATANLQWIAGLNAGLTAHSLAASHVWSDIIAEGVAEPRSLIHGIGRRWAGSWRTIRGSICNGFDVDQQFRFETRPTRQADGPHMFCDEDWIVHTGGWLSAMSRLMRP